MSITGPPLGTVNNGQPATFTIAGPNACAAAGTSVTWVFGDGTSVTSAGLVSPPHTYPTISPYTVTATVTSPIFGTFTPPAYTVTVNPVSLTLSYTNNSSDTVSNVIFTQGGIARYNIPARQLNGTQVTQGSYTIQVYLPYGTLFNPSTGTGYSSVSLIGDCTSGCSNYVAGRAGEYSFTLNISNCTTLNVNISAASTCP